MNDESKLAQATDKPQTTTSGPNTPTHTKSTAFRGETGGKKHSALDGSSLRKELRRCWSLTDDDCLDAIRLR
jgi:hypothetical protein